MVTSGIIPEFAEEIVEVAEGGEMVRKEREGGRGKAREERGTEEGVEGEMKGEEQKRVVGKKVHRESGMTKEEREGGREGGNEECIVGGRKGERKEMMKEDGKRGKVSSAIETAYYL